MQTNHPFDLDDDERSALAVVAAAHERCQSFEQAIKVHASKLTTQREARETCAAELAAADTAQILAGVDAARKGASPDAKAERQREDRVRQASADLAKADADLERGNRILATLQASLRDEHEALQAALPAAQNAHRAYLSRISRVLAEEMREASKPLLAAVARAADLAMAAGAMNVARALHEMVVIDLAEPNAPLMSRRRVKQADRSMPDVLDLPPDPGLDGLRAQVQGPRLALSAAAAYRPPVPTAPTKPAALAGAR